MGFKICSKCKHEKPRNLEYFGSDKNHSDGLHSWCRECTREYHRERYKNNAEHREYHKKHFNGRVKGYKLQVLEHYSGGTLACACKGCNEKRLEFLGIDHVNGNGSEHRRQINVKGGWHFYKWLVDNGFPEGYRVLCHNCNQSLGYYGYCPHASPELEGSLRQIKSL